MGLGVLFFFKSFFDTGINDLTTEILAAFLGSIITVMITMLIIRQQGSIEKAQETAAAHKTIIFEKKFELFRNFIGLYTECAVDGKLERTELEKLEKLAMVISLLANKEVKLQRRISRFVLQLQLFKLKNDHKEWGKEEQRQYKEYLDENYDENNGESPELIDITKIMDIMKMELRIDQLVDNKIEKCNYDEKNYEFVKKMLKHRKY